MAKTLKCTWVYLFGMEKHVWNSFKPLRESLNSMKTGTNDKEIDNNFPLKTVCDECLIIMGRWWIKLGVYLWRHTNNSKWGMWGLLSPIFCSTRWNGSEWKFLMDFSCYYSVRYNSLIGPAVFFYGCSIYTCLLFLLLHLCVLWW